MSAFDNVASNQARPLPVIVLADISGSMNDNGKMDSLKHALIDMVTSFKEASASALETEIFISIITFGNNSANIVLAPESATNVANNPQKLKEIQALQANGNTPLGLALTKLADLLEDKSIFPSRAYRPYLILVSDGMPNDKWEAPLQRLQSSKRAQKAIRLALAIGADADEKMLSAFINNSEISVIKANNAAEIKKFFKCVTISTIKDLQSINPGQAKALDIFNADDLFKDED